MVLDAGPLVAYLNGSDTHHAWAVSQFKRLEEPVLTCEPVWTEAAHLISKRGGSPGMLWPLVRNGAVQFAYRLKDDFESVASLMRRYDDLPMSLADACLVRMTELNADSRVLTLDRHFRVYRRFGRQLIRVVMPENLE